MPSNFVGFGTSYHGESDFAPDGTFITTEWLVLLFFPILPLGSHRMLRLPDVRPDGTLFLGRKSCHVGRVPLNWPQVFRVYLFIPWWLTFDVAVFQAPTLFGAAWGSMWGRAERILLYPLFLLPFMMFGWMRKRAASKAGLDVPAMMRVLRNAVPPDERFEIEKQWFLSLPLSEIMQVYARDTVRLVQQQLQVTIDYSETSLEAIDRLMESYSGGKLIIESELDEKRSEDLEILCKGLGAYVGEVIIRNIGGEWSEGKTEDNKSVMTLKVKGGLTTHPAHSIYRRFTEEYKGGAVSYYRAMKALALKERSESDGMTTYKVPPFSSEPPPLPGES